MTRYAFAFLCAALLAPAARAAEIPDVSSETQTLSATAGTVLGAAALCDGISGARITAATQKVARALAHVTTTEDDLAEARRRFTENIQPGRDALRSGELSCPQVEASLTRLEHLGEAHKTE
jgi:hypothetical protein